MFALLMDGPADHENLEVGDIRPHHGELVVLSYSADGYYALSHGPSQPGVGRSATWRPDRHASFGDIRMRRSRPRLSRP